MKDKALLSGRQRLLAAALAMGLLGPLVLAGILKPCADGLGTHRQVGLPPCTLVVLFGIRCPTCGMTTSWAHFVQGQPVEAIEANLAGTILCVIAVVTVPWLLMCAATGRWLGWKPNANVVAIVFVAIIVVALVDWVYRLL